MLAAAALVGALPSDMTVLCISARTLSYSRRIFRVLSPLRVVHAVADLSVAALVVTWHANQRYNRKRYRRDEGDGPGAARRPQP